MVSERRNIMATIIVLLFAIILLIFHHYKYKDKNINHHICESYIEKRLYNALKSHGFNPIPQVRCGPYRIDLALMEYKLAIECDGKEWHSTPEQKKHDSRKNYYLKKNGWKVCRLSGKTINSNLGYAINHIKKRAFL
jgi:very-short-patch-repair endonuclease